MIRDPYDEPPAKTAEQPSNLVYHQARVLVLAEADELAVPCETDEDAELFEFHGGSFQGGGLVNFSVRDYQPFEHSEGGILDFLAESEFLGLREAVDCRVEPLQQFVRLYEHLHVLKHCTDGLLPPFLLSLPCSIERMRPLNEHVRDE